MNSFLRTHNESLHLSISISLCDSFFVLFNSNFFLFHSSFYSQNQFLDAEYHIIIYTVQLMFTVNSYTWESINYFNYFQFEIIGFHSLGSFIHSFILFYFILFYFISIQFIHYFFQYKNVDYNLKFHFNWIELILFFSFWNYYYYKV